MGWEWGSALRDHLKGHTEALESLAAEMLARGLSVRDIEERLQWQWFVWQAGATYAPLAPSVAN